MTTERGVIHPPWLRAGKVATGDLIGAFGTQVDAEQATGKGQSRLSAYGAVNTDAFAPIDVVAKLERETHGTAGHPHVTRWLCRNAGGVFVAVPAAALTDRDWHGGLAGVAQETNDIVQRLCQALANGGVSAREVRRLRIREEISEALERLAALDAMAAAAPEDD